MNKRIVLWLFIVWLIIIVVLTVGSVVAGQGRTTAIGDKKYIDVPHGLTSGFENCLACHVGGLYTQPDDITHNEIANEQCISCHLLAVAQ